MGKFDLGRVVNKFIAKVTPLKGNNVNKTDKLQQTFANNNVSDPIGDTFQKSSNDNVTVDDLIALVDDASIDKNKLNKYTKEKPVATLGTLASLTNTSIPEDLQKMTEMTGKSGVGFYNDKAFADGSATRIGASTGATEELMNNGAKFTEAFYGALQS